MSERPTTSPTVQARARVTLARLWAQRDTPQGRRILIGAIATLSLVIVLWALLTPASAPPASGAQPGPPAPQVGHLAPDITLSTLADAPEKLSSLRGKVVALNFWYAACQPCSYEMPALEKTYLEHQSQGLVILGVNTSDDSPTIRDFANRIGISYPLVRDPSLSAVSTYGVTDTPTTFIIDRSGVIRAKIVGPVSRATLLSDVTPLLAASH